MILFWDKKADDRLVVDRHAAYLARAVGHDLARPGVFESNGGLSGPVAVRMANDPRTEQWPRWHHRSQSAWFGRYRFGSTPYLDRKAGPYLAPPKPVTGFCDGIGTQENHFDILMRSEAS